MSPGLSAGGVEGLHAALEPHVARGDMPGLVALVASGDDVHVETIGFRDFGDTEPIGRDAIFRVASITKPIAGVAAMLLVEDGAMALDDPVERWLPELASPRVLRTLESELDDTVPAVRPITVEHVLSFHVGYGAVMAAPDTYPIQRAERALGLKTYSEPWPPPNLTPDEWIAALGSLPLLHQPGEGWTYNTGAEVAGVLIERVAQAPIADVLQERVLGPLGMVDTAFWVPPEKLARFTTAYAPDPMTGELRLLDRPDGWWSTPPRMPNTAGWLVSTVDDLWAFAAMFVAGGGDLLSRESVAAMTTDRMTAAEREANAVFVGEHGGWGLMMTVPASGAAAGGTGAVPGGFGWDGGTGTSWRTDLDTGLTGILLTQRAMTSPVPPAVMTDFWAAAYAAPGA